MRSRLYGHSSQSMAKACVRPPAPQTACYLLDLQPVAECVPPYLVTGGTFMIFLRTSRRAREWIMHSPCLAAFFQPLPDLRCFVPDQTLLEEFMYALIMRLTQGWTFKTGGKWVVIRNPDHCCLLSERGIMSRYVHAEEAVDRPT